MTRVRRRTEAILHKTDDEERRDRKGQGGERSRSSSSDGEDGARGEEEKRHDGRWHVEENPRGPRAIARELAYRPRDEHAPGRREKTDPSDGAPSGAEDDASEPSLREAEGTIAPR